MTYTGRPLPLGFFFSRKIRRIRFPVLDCVDVDDSRFLLGVLECADLVNTRRASARIAEKYPEYREALHRGKNTYQGRFNWFPFLEKAFDTVNDAWSGSALPKKEELKTYSQFAADQAFVWLPEKDDVLMRLEGVAFSSLFLAAEVILLPLNPSAYRWRGLEEARPQQNLPGIVCLLGDVWQTLRGALRTRIYYQKA